MNNDTDLAAAAQPLLANVGQATILRQDIENMVKQYDHWAEFNRKLAIRIRVSTAAMAALATIFLGLKVDIMWQASLGNMALILSASISVVNVAESFYAARSNWVQAGVTVQRLKDLLFDLNYMERSSSFLQQDLDKIKDKFANVMKEDRDTWPSSIKEDIPVRAPVKTD